MKKRSLFNIGRDFEALDELIEEREGDVTDDEIREIIYEWMDENQDALATKVDGYVLFIKELDARADARRSLAREYDALAKMDERKVESLKKCLVNFMQDRNMDELAGYVHVVKPTRNGGALPVVVPDDLDLSTVPAEFIIQTPSLDKKKVFDALVSNVKVGFAKLGDRGFHLRIK